MFLRSECENLQEEVRELLLEKDENLHVIRLLETQKAILEEKVKQHGFFLGCFLYECHLLLTS